MAVLKQIKFGSSSTPIAKSVVAINENSTNALSVVATNDKLTDNADPTYTIALAVDGQTITKTGDTGLATALALKFEEAAGETPARIVLADQNGASGYNVLSSVPVSDLVGTGLVSSATYDPATGKLTIKWASKDASDTVIDLGALLDIEDIVIKSDSTDFLSFAAVSPAPDTDAGQAQIGVKLADVTFAAASGGNPADLTVNTANGKILDASDAIPAIKQYVDAQTTDLAVQAEGDNYITAAVDAQNNKKINVTADVQTLTATAGTPGVYADDGSETTAPTAGTLSGTANSLADGADIAEKVKTYVDGAIASEVARSDAKNKADIAALDATVGSQTVASGKHVAVEVVEVDGKLSALTVTEDNIASASDLTAEVNRAKSAETAIDTAVGLTKDASGEGRTWKPTSNYGGTTTSVKDNMQALDAQLKTVSDNLAAVKYKVTGTTLEFFGIDEKTGA